MIEKLFLPLLSILNRQVEKYILNHNSPKKKLLLKLQFLNNCAFIGKICDLTCNFWIYIICALLDISDLIYDPHFILITIFFKKYVDINNKHKVIIIWMNPEWFFFSFIYSIKLIHYYFNKYSCIFIIWNVWWYLIFK